MEMERVNVNGIKLAYARRGQGTPLLLIHGYPLDHSIWDPLAPFLEHQFDLIIPDLRGFGESEVKQGETSLGDYASDIAGLLDQLKIKKAYVAGHSMGGYVALALIRGFGERVSGLGMVSSQMAADSPDRKEGRYATAQQVLATGVSLVADSMGPKLSSEPRWQEFAHSLIEKQSPAGIAAALRAMAERPDSTELFKSLPFPVVIVHGDADQLIPVQRGREMKAAYPAAQYTELPGAGHSPMMEQPERVAEALGTFTTVKVKGT